MPRTCMGCGHPDLEEINKALIVGDQLQDGGLLSSCQLLRREPVNGKRCCQSGTVRHFIRKYLQCRGFLHQKRIFLSNVEKRARGILKKS
jgi:hypothetical protein